jgi:surfactin synthase thioesterase subunit
VRDLAEHLISTLPLDEAMPYAIFGTCLGAIVGYEMIQLLERTGRQAPLLFFPAAVSPPDIYSSVITAIYDPHKAPFSLFGVSKSIKMDVQIKERVLNRLKSWRSLPKRDVLYAFEAGHFAGIEEMKRSDELFERVAPMAVNDIIMACKYEYNAEFNKPISCPIIAFDGMQDNTIPRGYMKGWRRHTRKSFKRIPIDNNHYFVASNYLDLVSFCSSACLRALERQDERKESPREPRHNVWRLVILCVAVSLFAAFLTKRGL